jgi:hypothetical protein
MLKTGSDKIIYLLGRYSFLLDFYNVKKPKRFGILNSNQKFRRKETKSIYRVNKSSYQTRL